MNGFTGMEAAENGMVEGYFGRVQGVNYMLNRGYAALCAVMSKIFRFHDDGSNVVVVYYFY